MKIVHISQSDYRGGAGRAVQRIHDSLESIGIETEVWVENSKHGNKEIVLGFKKKLLLKIKKKFSALLARLIFGRGQFVSLSLFSSGLINKINNSDADVIHLHWTAGELLSIEDIGKIKLPIVWTFHDMWPFSGVYHTHENRNRNNISQSFFDIRSQLDRWITDRKRCAWSKQKFNVVVPSNWMKEELALKNIHYFKNVHLIHHGLSRDFWHPIPRFDYLKLLKFKANYNFKLLFISASSVHIENKGWKLLVNALNMIENEKNIPKLEIYIAGEYDPHASPQLTEKVPAISLGIINSDEYMRAIYNFVDLVCVPSKVESFGLGALEAHFCGTPVLAFDTSGIKDIVIHGKTGYLAQPYDPKSLSHYLMKIIENQNAKKFSHNLKTMNLYKFTDTYMAKKYVDFYNDAISRHQSW